MDETNTYKEPIKAVQCLQNSAALNAEWLASLSHELRSPLTAIQGYANILLRHADCVSPEERYEFLQAISQGSKRLASILDCFLDLANLEAGAIQLYLSPVDLVQLVEDVIRAELQKYPTENISLTSDPMLPLDPHLFIINADDSLIRKMLIQLLDNAQKYSALCTPIEITLSCYTLKQRLLQIPAQIRTQLPREDQRFVELSIQDHGIGIPITDHERIFERFERVDMQLTRPVSGLGLGLTMCKYIVALHHGAIWVESIPGEGSTFHVLFPAGYDYT